MTEGAKILVTIDDKIEKWIDETLKEINSNKDSWQTHANRQGLIRACIRYAMQKNPAFESHWSRDVYLTPVKQE